MVPTKIQKESETNSEMKIEDEETNCEMKNEDEETKQEAEALLENQD